ncbi:hypothetical protein HNR46_001054 [Haloferula luteola]|uniref:PEP-CTERM protein-sorting domain-containing protein n=1 Tax=Haloferula luteola TaxID=595692 RepID=A0A840VA45_9BACT|nr:PEP-CTERM sorting domain-containing protein [Haloferula luteola]MBB5350820.1 hypothetical protein [Haloferula luteola]
MKPSLLLCLPALALGASSLNAAVLYDFNSEVSDAFFSSDISGWSQDIANPTPFGAEAPMAYVADASIVGGVATGTGYLGTLRVNQAPHATTSITGDLSAAGTMSGYSLSMNFGILDNTSDPYTTRDSFSIAVTDSTTATLGMLSITPTVGDVNLWDLSVVGGTGSVTVDVNSGYVLFITFLDDAVKFSYGSAASGVGSIEIGEVAASVSGDFGSLVLTHTPDASEALGTSANALIFDNIAVVPEPGTALLCGVAALGLMRRRRVA